jgi:flagellar biosynthesis protein FlhF
MRLETFRGRTLHRVLADVRQTLGEDAMILRTQTVVDDGTDALEVVATTWPEVLRFRRRLEGTGRVPARGRSGPLVVALVGPSGAGKTTTAAKLAVHPSAFGGRRAGFVTLDTFRVGGVEQLALYAEIAGVPLEVVYEAAEVPGALQRLRRCDVVLVDTPGRSPRVDAAGGWRGPLTRLAPDEVHLVLPAGIRLDVAARMKELYAPVGVTHLLLSKLDEVPGEAGVAELADALELPARWAADGQGVPADLHAAGARLLSSLDLDRALGGVL